MSRALGLAKQAGMTIHTDDAEYVAMLQNFYALARADLEADLAATRDLAEGYAQERNELKAENAALLAANRDCIDHFNQLKVDFDDVRAENAKLKAALQRCKDEAGVPENVWKAARAALGEQT